MQPDDLRAVASGIDLDRLDDSTDLDLRWLLEGESGVTAPAATAPADPTAVRFTGNLPASGAQHGNADTHQTLVARVERAREVNRKSQARFRQRQKEERDRLVNVIKERRRQLGAAQEALTAAAATRSELLSRCTTAVTALCELTDSVHAAATGDATHVTASQLGTGAAGVPAQHERHFQALSNTHSVSSGPSEELPPALSCSGVARRPSHASCKPDPHAPAGGTAQGSICPHGGVQRGVGAAEQRSTLFLPISYDLVNAGRRQPCFQEAANQYMWEQAQAYGVAVDDVQWCWQMSHMCIDPVGPGAGGRCLSSALRNHGWRHINSYGYCTGLNMLKAALWFDEREMLQRAISICDGSLDPSRWQAWQPPATNPSEIYPAIPKCEAATRALLEHPSLCCGINEPTSFPDAARQLLRGVLESCTSGLLSMAAWRHRAGQLMRYLANTARRLDVARMKLVHQNVAILCTLCEEIASELAQQPILSESQLVEMGPVSLKQMLADVTACQVKHCEAWAMDMYMLKTQRSSLFQQVSVQANRPDSASYVQAHSAELRMLKILSFSPQQRMKLAGVWEHWVQQVHTHDQHMQTLAAQLLALPTQALIPVRVLSMLNTILETPTHELLKLQGSSDFTHPWATQLIGPSAEVFQRARALSSKICSEQHALMDARVKAVIAPWFGEHSLTSWQLQWLFKEQLETGVYLVDNLRLCQLAAEHERRHKMMSRFLH